VKQTANIRVFTHTPMVGAYNNNLITAFQVGKAGDAFTERYIEIRSESVVVATGCIERPPALRSQRTPRRHAGGLRPSHGAHLRSAAGQ
jgi:sarcosine oxidase subunit alpha